MNSKFPEIVAIGGSNIDITGFSHERIRIEDSNPGRLNLCMGGVMRNIAENLSRLELPLKLVTAFGDDLYGENLKQHCLEMGIDISLAKVSRKYPTSTYLSIIDYNGDMVVAINDMDILNELTVEFFQSISLTIQQADFLILDTNLDNKIIAYLLKTTAGKVFLDTVSAKKAPKIKNQLHFIHTLKTNQLEASVLSGIEINSKSSALKVVEYFLEKGIKQVFLTMGKAGVVYGNSEQKGHYRAGGYKIVNETGAGDAFVAAVLYGYINKFQLEDMAKWASAASILTAENEQTNHPGFSRDTIQNRLKDL